MFNICNKLICPLGDDNMMWRTAANEASVAAEHLKRRVHEYSVSCLRWIKNNVLGILSTDLVMLKFWFWILNIGFLTCQMVVEKMVCFTHPSALAYLLHYWSKTFILIGQTNALTNKTQLKKYTSESRLDQNKYSIFKLCHNVNGIWRATDIRRGKLIKFVKLPWYREGSSDYVGFFV